MRATRVSSCASVNLSYEDGAAGRARRARSFEHVAVALSQIFFYEHRVLMSISLSGGSKFCQNIRRFFSRASHSVRLHARCEADERLDGLVPPMSASPTTTEENDGEEETFTSALVTEELYAKLSSILF